MNAIDPKTDFEIAALYCEAIRDPTLSKVKHLEDYNFDQLYAVINLQSSLEFKKLPVVASKIGVKFIVELLVKRFGFPLSTKNLYLGVMADELAPMLRSCRTSNTLYDLHWTVIKNIIEGLFGQSIVNLTTGLLSNGKKDEADRVVLDTMNKMGEEQIKQNIERLKANSAKLPQPEFNIFVPTADYNYPPQGVKRKNSASSDIPNCKLTKLAPASEAGPSTQANDATIRSSTPEPTDEQIDGLSDSSESTIKPPIEQTNEEPLMQMKKSSIEAQINDVESHCLLEDDESLVKTSIEAQISDVEGHCLLEDDDLLVKTSIEEQTSDADSHCISESDESEKPLSRDDKIDEVNRDCLSEVVQATVAECRSAPSDSDAGESLIQETCNQEALVVVTKEPCASDGSSQVRARSQNDDASSTSGESFNYDEEDGEEDYDEDIDYRALNSKVALKDGSDFDGLLSKITS